MPPLRELFDLSGRVAIVTGGSRGLGLEMAEGLGQAGAALVICARREEWLTPAAAALRTQGFAVEGVVCDVSRPDQVQSVVDRAISTYGQLDILINNAGVSGRVSVEADGYGALWARTFAINLTAQVNVIRACLPHLLRSGGGRIVNIASTEGLGATAGISPYTASKHGVVGLTRSLAVELGRRGVTVNCICPGPIHTGITAGIPDEAKAKFARRRVPLGRYGDPEEVAHMTLSLVLPAASYVNGAVVVVDGGMLAQNT